MRGGRRLYSEGRGEERRGEERKGEERKGEIVLIQIKHLNHQNIFFHKFVLIFVSSSSVFAVLGLR